MAWHLGEHAAPRKPRFDSQQPQFTIICNPSSQRIWCPSDLCGQHRHTCRENNQTHKTKQNLVIIFILVITKHFSHTHGYVFIYTCKSTFACILWVELWYIDLFFTILVCYITSFFKLWFCIWIYHDLPISLYWTFTFNVFYSIP